MILGTILSRDSTRAVESQENIMVPDSYFAGGETEARAMEILNCWMGTSTHFVNSTPPSRKIPEFLSITLQITTVQIDTLRA